MNYGIQKINFTRKFIYFLKDGRQFDCPATSKETIEAAETYMNEADNIQAFALRDSDGKILHYQKKKEGVIC